VGRVTSPKRGTLADAGLAALATFVRTLSIEASAVEIGVQGVALTAHQGLPGLLLGEEGALPSGTWLDLRPPAAPNPLPVPTDNHPVPPSRRVAVVTGAAGGLGRAISVRFASQGDVVILVDRDEPALGVAMEEIGKPSGTLEAHRADVRYRSELARVAEAVRDRWGRIDVWVNNAGIAEAGRIDQLRTGDWDRVIETNLGGTLWGTQVAAVAMGARAGVILNFSSTSANSAGLVYPGRYNAYAPYPASKAGVEALTSILAGPLGPRVRINAIAPGPILTELTDRIYTVPQKAELQRHIPLRRLGTPEEIAAIAAFLTSQDAGFISGSVLRVDGGLSAYAGYGNQTMAPGTESVQ